LGASTRLAFADLERAIAAGDPQLGELATPRSTTPMLAGEGHKE
jgi:hypothetical protein